MLDASKLPKPLALKDCMCWAKKCCSWTAKRPRGYKTNRHLLCGMLIRFVLPSSQSGWKCQIDPNWASKSEVPDSTSWANQTKNLQILAVCGGCYGWETLTVGFQQNLWKKYGKCQDHPWSSCTSKSCYAHVMHMSSTRYVHVTRMSCITLSSHLVQIGNSTKCYSEQAAWTRQTWPTGQTICPRRETLIEKRCLNTYCKKFKWQTKK